MRASERQRASGCTACVAGNAWLHGRGSDDGLHHVRAWEDASASTMRRLRSPPWGTDRGQVMRARSSRPSAAASDRRREELEATYAAIDESPLNAFSHLDREHATVAAGVADVVAAVRRRADRRQGARPGRRLAVHRGVGPARRSHRHLDVGDGAAHPRPRRRGARRPDHGVGVRRRQRHPHRPPRHDGQPVAARPHARRLVRRLGRRGRRRPGHARHRR